MNFSLNKNIYKVCSQSLKSTIEILQKGITNEKFPHSKYILKGNINENKINAVIIPPKGIVDPFKSRVRGKIDSRDYQTAIFLHILPSSFFQVFLIIWTILILVMVFSFENNGFTQPLQIIGIVVLWLIIPIALIKLKVIWDARRLEKWIDERLAP